MKVEIVNQLYDAPAVGTQLEVDDQKGLYWIKAGIAKLVVEQPKPIERADEPPAEQRKRAAK